MTILDMEITLIIAGGILLGCFIGLSWFAGTDAPYVPTKMQRIRKVLKLVNLKRGETFWELGSGDGRVVLEAAKMGAIAYGIEQSWIRVLYSRWIAKKSGLKNAHFIHENIFSSFPTTRQPLRGGVLAHHQQNTPEGSISNADIVFIFLLPKGVEKLEPLLRKNLKQGVRVITQTFHFKNWKPYKNVLITDTEKPNTLLGKNKYEGDFRIYKI